MEQIVELIFEKLAILNEDYTLLSKNYNQIAIDIAILQTQVGTLLRWHWLVATSIVGIVIIQAAQLLQMRKNNK